MTDDYAQPHVTYNRITGSIAQRGVGRWVVVIRKWHSETGVERYEESTRHWPTEEEARRAAQIVVAEMQGRIAKSYGG